MLIQESAHTFPDNYMHFGGDEVSSSMLQCWYVLVAIIIKESI